MSVDSRSPQLSYATKPNIVHPGTFARANADETQAAERLNDNAQSAFTLGSASAARALAVVVQTAVNAAKTAITATDYTGATTQCNTALTNLTSLLAAFDDRGITIVDCSIPRATGVNNA